MCGCQAIARRGQRLAELDLRLRALAIAIPLLLPELRVAAQRYHLAAAHQGAAGAKPRALALAPSSPMPLFSRSTARRDALLAMPLASAATPSSPNDASPMHTSWRASQTT